MPGRSSDGMDSSRDLNGIVCQSRLASKSPCDVQRFPSGRHFASYLGLTPRERSTGQRRQLGAISKRGDAYLRMLLIHGARAVLCHAKTKTAPAPDRLRAWALHLERFRGHNKAAVALANKLARIAWAVWKYDTDFAAAPAA